MAANKPTRGHTHPDLDRGDGVPPVAPKLWRSSAEVIAETMAEVQLRHDYPDVGGLRSGLQALDKHAREAFMPGSLVVIAGESGRGKTALMTQLAVAFSAQAPTLAISLEDRASATLKRALANVSRTNVGRIRAGFAGEAGIPKAIYDAAELLSNGNLDMIDGVSLTVEQIAAQVWAWKKERPDAAVVLIDQLSHIVPSLRTNQAYFSTRNLPVPPAPNAADTVVLEWQCNILKVVAERLGMCIVLAHQLNENHAEGQKPTVRSIRGSRGIVHKADLVVVPWVPEKVENPFAGPGQTSMLANDTGEGRLLIIKGREVARSEEVIYWIGAEQRFADPDQRQGEYTAPDPVSARAKEGMRRLVELRQRFTVPAELEQ